MHYHGMLSTNTTMIGDITISFGLGEMTDKLASPPRHFYHDWKGQWVQKLSYDSCVESDNFQGLFNKFTTHSLLIHTVNRAALTHIPKF